MKFKTNATILGARRFNDTVEGTKHDFTKVRVSMPVPDGNRNEVGFNSVEMVFGTHENFMRFENLIFPCEAEIELMATTKGYEFLNFKPNQANLQPAKAA